MERKFVTLHESGKETASILDAKGGGRTEPVDHETTF